METVRRRKLCTNIKRLKPNKKKTYKRNTMDASKEKQRHENCSNDISKCHPYDNCSNDISKCHPYEGDINFVHVLCKTLDETHSLACHVKQELDDFIHLDGFVPREETVFPRYENAVSVLVRLNSAVERRETNIKIKEYFYNFQQEFMDDVQLDKKVVPCGSYHWALDKYIDHAAECVRRSQSKHERRSHGNKLKVFTALKRLLECNLYREYDENVF